jgi:hypothetical protein
MIRRRLDAAVGPSQVLARSRAKNAGSGVSLGPALFNRSVAGELAFGEIAQHHGGPLRRMARDSSAEADLDIVGMRAEHEQVDQNRSPPQMM